MKDKSKVGMRLGVIRSDDDIAYREGRHNGSGDDANRRPEGKRQILASGLPGDFIGLPSCLFDVAVNWVSPLTDVEVSPVSFRNLFNLFARFSRVGTALFCSSASEVAMYGRHLVDLGCRSAYERLAHLILELLVRLRDAASFASLV
jgi:hypothetical protein